MLYDPVKLLQAMSLVDRTDSTILFAGNHQGPRQPGRQPQPPRPSPYQGIRTGYPRPGAGGNPSNPVPIELGIVDTVQPRGFRDMSTVKCYNCGTMGHFACQCGAPRRYFQQQGQASIMMDRGNHFYQPYSVVPPPPPSPYDVQSVLHELLKNE